MKIKRIIIEHDDETEPPIAYIPHEKADFYEIIGNVGGALSELGIVPPNQVDEKDADEDDG